MILVPALLPSLIVEWQLSNKEAGCITGIVTRNKRYRFLFWHLEPAASIRSAFISSMSDWSRSR